MKKLALIYTTSTGNTEALAEAFIEGIKKVNIDLTVIDAFSAYAQDLLAYDGILIGTYTWEGGVIPDEFMPLYEELDDIDLTGKLAMIFGTGDSYYGKTFGEALKQFSEKVTVLGASLFTTYFLVDLYPDTEEVERAKVLGEEFAHTINSGVFPEK